jgi:hypothetical protein
LAISPQHLQKEIEENYKKQSSQLELQAHLKLGIIRRQVLCMLSFNKPLYNNNDISGGIF